MTAPSKTPHQLKCVNRHERYWRAVSVLRRCLEGKKQFRQPAYTVCGDFWLTKKRKAGKMSVSYADGFHCCQTSPANDLISIWIWGGFIVDEASVVRESQNAKNTYTVIPQRDKRLNGRPIWYHIGRPSILTRRPVKNERKDTQTWLVITLVEYMFTGSDVWPSLRPPTS